MTKTTKAAALFKFFNSFGLEAHPSSATEGAQLPYITYDLAVGADDSGDVNIPVNIWYRTDSEKTLNDKVEEISARIGRGGTTLPCDGGFIWLTRGTPWAQAVKDPDDETVKRRFLNITAKFETLN